jgi:alpha-D-xyloside xylohydrolase
LHGSNSYRVPWLFDDEAVEVMREFAQLKQRLLPYLQDAAGQAQEHGAPIMRAMALQFPEDPACRPLDTQYMLGDDLLVAPVLRADGTVDVYLPAGEWVHLLDGETITTGDPATGIGGSFVSRTYDVHSLGLFARQGAPVLKLALGEA